MEVVLPGDPLIGQEGSGDPVLSGYLGYRPSESSARETQVYWESVLDIHPNEGENLFIGKSYGVVNGIANESPVVGEVTAMGNIPESIFVPELRQQPNDDDQGTDHY
jgi:hypothetical protein